MDPIIDEKFDRLDGYTWTRSSGVQTTIYQEEGLDLVIMQEQNGDTRSVWHYSEAGMCLFSALLAYQRGRGEISSLEDIGHVLGDHSDRRGSINPNIAKMVEFACAVMPTCDGNRVILTDPSRFYATGAYMGGLIYFAFQEGETCIIASSHDEGNVEIGMMQDGEFQSLYTSGFRRELVLDDEDVKRILKGIYFYAHDKKALEIVYAEARKIK